MSVLEEVVAVVRGVEAVAGPFWLTVQVLFQWVEQLAIGVVGFNRKGSWYNTAHKDTAE